MMSKITNNTVIKINNKLYFCKDIQTITEQKITITNLELYDYSSQKFIKMTLNNIDNIQTISLLASEIVFASRNESIANFTCKGEIYSLDTQIIDFSFIALGSQCIGYFYQDKLMKVCPNDQVILSVKKCERKNQRWQYTGMKNVLLESEIWIQVPLESEISVGDKIKIDTKNYTFISKV